MLKKLLKYDLINIYKFLIIFYALALFFAVLTRIFLNIENSLVMNILGQICGGVTISMMFNIIINNMMRMWARFKQNLYGDESYLTHTLPVKRSDIYISKFITSLLTNFTSITVIVFSLYIAYGTRTVVDGINGLLNSFADSLNISPVLIILVLIFIFFIEFLNILQCGFTGLILGHRRNNAKTGFSVLFGFLIYIISQMLILVLIFAVALTDKDFMNLFVTNEIVNLNTVKAVFVLATVGYTVICGVGFVLNQKLLNKGVNVD